MPYQPNKPLPPDDLDISVTDIQQNFLIANTVMDIDHYPFDNLTANKGFHKTVTTPDQGAVPAVTTASKLFGWQLTAPLNDLQYSIVPGDTVPTPVSYKQSQGAFIPLTFGNTTPVMDFTGIGLLIGRLYMMEFDTLVFNGIVDVLWNGTTFSFFPNTGVLQAFQNVNILEVKYAIGPGPAIKVYWTLCIFRVQ